MILRSVILSITTASAVPVVLESHRGPVPEESRLKSLLASAPDADSAADLLLEHYQDHGFPAVGVEVNDLDGKRQVDIDVARYGQILLGGGPERTRAVAKKSFATLAGQYVDQKELKKSLRHFHANPLHRAVPRLQPSADGMKVNALFRIEQSSAQQFSVGFHDTGAHPLPRERFWIQGDYSDLWNRNSLTTARLTTAIRPEEFHAVQIGSRFFQSNGHEVGLSLSYSGASGRQISDFDAYTWQIGAHWKGAETTLGDWKGRSQIGLSYRRTNNALEFGDFRNRGVADVVHLTLGHTLERQWKRGLTRINGSLVLSPFGDDEEHSVLRRGAKGEYGLARFAVWHRQDLKNNWDLVVNFGSQWASDPVLQADQLALGGASGIRGLPEQFALGDKGYLGGIEIRAPIIELTTSWRLRPSAFLQSGKTIDMVADTHTSATTAGLGLQIGDSDGLRASVYSAWRLDEGGSEVHSQLSWKF